MGQGPVATAKKAHTEASVPVQAYERVPVRRQVLEILNDAEVRLLAEGAPPAPLPNGASADTAPRLPFWQWAARQRADAAPPLQRAA